MGPKGQSSSLAPPSSPLDYSLWGISPAPPTQIHGTIYAGEHGRIMEDERSQLMDFGIS